MHNNELVKMYNFHLIKHEKTSSQTTCQGRTQGGGWG